MTTITASLWKTVLLKGILYTILGFVILIWPYAALGSLLYIIGIYAVIVGAAEVIIGFISRDIGKVMAILMIILGILGIVIGVMILKNPAASFLVFIYLLGVWLLAKGVLDIIGFGMGKKESRGFHIFIGILSVIVGILLLNEPIAKGLVLFWILGFYSIIVGPILISLSLLLRAEEE